MLLCRLLESKSVDVDEKCYAPISPSEPQLRGLNLSIDFDYVYNPSRLFKL